MAGGQLHWQLIHLDGVRNLSNRRPSKLTLYIQGSSWLG
jgi:hypothetical protein